MKKQILIATYSTILAIAASVFAFAETATHTVTLTGKISCAKCQGIQPMHKGFTRWTWALHSVSEGDDIVLVAGNGTYKLQGDKDQLLKHMEDKVTVSGDLEGNSLFVKTIGPFR